MSTLNEIAANHARMAKALVEASTGPSERHTQIVETFEVPTLDAQHMPLHLIASVQDNPFGQATAYLL
ncbi:hypothetical protein SAMN04490185_3419 [Pseudomonas frederiksbergensis]|uniref:Uncharacterized protein n=1 Tax=Pseudomonas frederiksbergensis TaxID=104087 RepID=A0A1P8F0Q2_9PSED|nr:MULTISPECIES: hypothetical protein [Pseudomonas]APV42044.1 hypothetical protein PFAS1_22945 [Pseudomonas frederiksbergensis]PMU08693.1 hypothetical protein C1Y11_20390 [Pseudomonas sp. FW305-20]PMU16457.1 hypothetical protein C1Y10_19060 [Pseudomonas sp. FW305-122]PMU40723.1 hypothetical protein C1Y12_10050 [Pseudomonas sp. FW305-47B]PMX58362.1 hypothetical protein C1Y13_20600 [Pseudomonas sp. FW305-33]